MSSNTNKIDCRPDTHVLEEPPIYQPQYYSFSPKLKMWYEESYTEKNCWNEAITVCEDFALYPARFYATVSKFDKTKKYDYCFIGGLKIDIPIEKNTNWILGFIRRKFTSESYLQFTDMKTKSGYLTLGEFDFTLIKNGFTPKEHKVEERNWFDSNYFKTMSKSKFTLCPAGDLIYSMRFYEALMCNSIPIVNTKNETFRSEAESKLDYKYYVSTDQITYREDWTVHNYELFLKYHTLDGLTPT